MTDPVTMTLREPVTAHGETVSQLTFRPPTGKDIRDCGMPFSMSSEGAGAATTKMEAAAIARYVSRLAGIPTSSVDKLSAQDFTEALGIVLGFFGRTEEGEPAGGSTAAPDITIQ